MLTNFLKKQFALNEEAEKTKVTLCIRKQYDSLDDSSS